MRLGFVGKGGSGKSTVAAAVALVLRQALGRPLLVIDADINQHLASLLGVSPPPSLNDPATAAKLRAYVRGESPLIREDRHVIRTTPPGAGTRAIGLDRTDTFFADIARWECDTALLGTGEPLPETTGTKCYHNNLVPLEILLNHLSEDDGTVIIDMMAGVDAFSTSMHIQLDALCLVVEPSAESAGVAREYLDMARRHGMADRVLVVANQVEDESDMAYLRSRGIEPAAILPWEPGMRRVVREGRGLDLSGLAGFAEAVGGLVRLLSSEVVPMSAAERRERLVELHRVQAEKKHHPATREELLAQIG